MILKLGDQGCFYSGPEGEFRAPGFAVQAVDTTAAGDTFNAGFAVALAEGMGIEPALRFGNAAAAISGGAFSAATTRRRKRTIRRPCQPNQPRDPATQTTMAQSAAPAGHSRFHHTVAFASTAAGVPLDSAALPINPHEVGKIHGLCPECAAQHRRHKIQVSRFSLEKAPPPDKNQRARDSPL